MAVKRNTRLLENIEDDETSVDDETQEEEPTSLKAKVAETQANRGKRPARQEKAPVVAIRTVADSYNIEDDYAVPHSGSTDENGTPRYDESPVAGGMIVTSGSFMHTEPGEIVNANGHEIDPDDTDHRGRAKVIDPERYIESEPDFS